MSGPALPPEPPGLDAGAPAVDHAGGIARLMGDGVLFARVLARFRNEYRETAAGIRHALDNGDSASALRLAHTLKGAAGMIEARPLKSAAQALEQDLRSGGGDAHACLAPLEQALGQVLRELDAAAAHLPPPKPAAPAPGPAQRDALARLSALLDEGNGDAVDLVRGAEAALRAELGDEGYDSVAEAIESFDFDAALAMLKNRAA
jgi:HPt (histidine-containing phosphotransfer) domain-containing protein